MKFETKKDLIQELINDKQFITPEGNTLMYDEDYTSDFGLEIKGVLYPADLNSLIKYELTEVKKWYEGDDIKPLLCIFSDDPIPEVIKDLRGYLVQFFDRYDKNSGYFYGKDYRWNHCRPLTKEQAAEFGL